jgi:hypothetical protein
MVNVLLRPAYTPPLELTALFYRIAAYFAVKFYGKDPGK